jgi:hypothetical protein
LSILKREPISLDVLQGEHLQVGLRPDPFIGYEGEDMGEGGFAGQHGTFVEQRVISGVSSLPSASRTCYPTSGSPVTEHATDLIWEGSAERLLAESSEMASACSGVKRPKCALARAPGVFSVHVFAQEVAPAGALSSILLTCFGFHDRRR